MKPTIKSYEEFMRTHTKYSRSPHFNMDRHGFHCVHEREIEIYDNNKTERSRDAVQDYINAVGEDTFTDYVYYRTRGGWDLPYIFIFAKPVKGKVTYGNKMYGSLYVVTDKLVVNPETKVWCKLPYPSHPNGCPNYGKKDVCPPRAPDVREFFDFGSSLFFVVVKFDLEAHVKKMHERLPHWSERQCRNLLYWQPSVMKVLKTRVGDCFHLPNMNVFNDKVSYVPEAMGVDVFETCFKLGIPIERNPVKYVHKIALVGKLKRRPMVIGSGYIPFIDKDEREPETFAEMASMTGGW